eukprot:TRINITY_DN6519_c0_g1_i12.p1 TRINITY_DN6519_c0_g1~~TRINITY_DN6519_c0_g1_i12.p1  ORF type:complete len:452 (+),score=179.92 TRINITY_DN6519_c0_g1_i12:163-1356(+)
MADLPDSDDEEDDEEEEEAPAAKAKKPDDKKVQMSQDVKDNEKKADPKAAGAGPARKGTGFVNMADLPDSDDEEDDEEEEDNEKKADPKAAGAGPARKGTGFVNLADLPDSDDEEEEEEESFKKVQHSSDASTEDEEDTAESKDVKDNEKKDSEDEEDDEEVTVKAPEGVKEVAECLRDLKRNLAGGNVFILNGRHRHPICLQATPGDESKEARDAALAQLASSLQDALGEEGVDFKDLALRAATHLSVAPGMQAVLSQELEPALWQPAYVICIGNGEVKVFTLAFVGTPIAGDRPDCKRSGQLIRLMTSNLLTKATQSDVVRFKVEDANTDIASVDSFLTIYEEELCQWAATGRISTPADAKPRQKVGGFFDYLDFLQCCMQPSVPVKKAVNDSWL